MASPFANTIAAAFDTLKAAAGEAVTVHRGGASAAVTAVPGTSTLDVEVVGERMAQQVRSSDWIVAAADLGTLYPPKKGDLYKRVVGSNREVFEVMTPAWRPSDDAGARVRVHTRRIATEAV